MLRSNLINEKDYKIIKDFHYLGYFDLENNLNLVFKQISEVLHNKIIYAIVCNGSIVYFGYRESTQKIIDSIINKSGKTYQRLNDNIILSLMDKKVVHLYYNNSGVKFDYLDRYKNEFVKNPLWNRKIDKKSKNSIVKKYFKNNENIKDIIENDDQDEFLSNRISKGIYNRCVDVKKEALRSAQNKCLLNEFSNGCIYFERRNRILCFEKEYYLEVHHLIPLWSFEIVNKIMNKNFLKQDLDVVENTVCLCSNCHNKLHYGKQKEVFKMLEELYKLKYNDLEKAGLNISLDKIKEIYAEL